MSKSLINFLSFIIAGEIIAMSFTFVYAQDKIEGSYEVVLTLPKATPTAILTFCPSGEPFTGAWLENGGEKFVGEMYNQKINGKELSFTIKAGPGIWDFACSIDGKSIKGTVTGDGATSKFEGPRITLEEDYCAK